MTQLDNLIDPASGWSLEVASGINDRGQIAGYGATTGAYMPFA